MNRRRMIVGSTLMVGFALTGAQAQAPNGLPMRSNPKTLPPPVGFSHLSEGRGRLVWVSGQVPRDPKGELIGPGDFGVQVEQVFRNLDIAVKEAGGRFSDVVKLNYYCHQSVDRSLLRNVNIVRDRYVDVARPPASTFVFVAGLARPDWLIEIEAILALPEEQMISVHAAISTEAPISSKLLDAARQLAAATRSEPGCMSYQIGVDIERESVLRLSETWVNLAALDAHFATPHMAAFRKVLGAEKGVRTEINVFAVSGRERLGSERGAGPGNASKRPT